MMNRDFLLGFGAGKAAGGGGGGAKTATGTFTVTTSGTLQQTISHGLNSDKIIAILQRVNADHSDAPVDATDKEVAFLGLSANAVNWDETQKYATETGNPVAFASTRYPSGMNVMAASGSLTYSQSAKKTTGVVVVDANTVNVIVPFGMCVGRWVWTIYAI